LNLSKNTLVKQYNTDNNNRCCDVFISYNTIYSGLIKIASSGNRHLEIKRSKNSLKNSYFYYTIFYTAILFDYSKKTKKTKKNDEV